MRKGRGSLLLVSDDLDFCKEIEYIASDAELVGLECQRVFPASKAVHEISLNTFDLIIFDIADMDEIIPLIEKLLKIRPHIPMIGMVSTCFDQASVLIKAGLVDVLSKSQLEKPLLQQKIVSYIERGKMEKMVKIRGEILEAVNLAAESFLLDSTWENSIDRVLTRLGLATGSDRVYVFRNGDIVSSGLEVLIVAEWSNDGIPAKKELMTPSIQTYESMGLGRWRQQLSEGQILHGEVEDLPIAERQVLTRMDVKSLVVAPIFVDRCWWGFIGFDQCRKAQGWSHIQIEALRTAANILGAALSRQSAEKKLTFLATHDYLTDLPNRMLFEDRFHQAIAHADRSGDKVAVISLDLDKFKSVNDSYGHPSGDIVLIEVGKRLIQTLRESDTCARIGGDEFGIIAESIHNKADVIKVMEKITHAFDKPMIVEGDSIDVSASMGAAIFPNDGKDLESIMKSADRALYDVKGKQLNFKVYEDIQFPLPGN